ncbi:MAG: hypothetical protein HPY70_09775 [Firmicutes bacterium]|nr:hypothetical protein [Bacillota bacterium]
MGKKIVILGTLDTKGQEIKFVKDIVESTGVETIVINVGVKGKPFLQDGGSRFFSRINALWRR